jgi:hypothetical protein
MAQVCPNADECAGDVGASYKHYHPKYDSMDGSVFFAGRNVVAELEGQKGKHDANRNHSNEHSKKQPACGGKYTGVDKCADSDKREKRQEKRQHRSHLYQKKSCVEMVRTLLGRSRLG